MALKEGGEGGVRAMEKEGSGTIIRDEGRERERGGGEHKGV